MSSYSIIGGSVAISEQQRQKKLLKKKQKKTAVVNAAKSFMSVSASSCAGYPIYECVTPTNLFELGIGEVFVSRRLPNGQLAVSLFLIDVFCLGIKDAYFRVMTDEEYENLKLKVAGYNRQFERIHQSCARKLVEGAVEYAKDLGFTSSSGYLKTAQLFGSIDAGVCLENYEYGKSGQPFYFRGPNESLSQAKKIVDTLHMRCGEGRFGFMIQEGDGDFDL